MIIMISRCPKSFGPSLIAKRRINENEFLHFCGHEADAVSESVQIGTPRRTWTIREDQLAERATVEALALTRDGRGRGAGGCRDSHSAANDHDQTRSSDDRFELSILHLEPK